MGMLMGMLMGMQMGMQKCMKMGMKMGMQIGMHMEMEIGIGKVKEGKWTYFLPHINFQNIFKNKKKNIF